MSDIFPQKPVVYNSSDSTGSLSRVALQSLFPFGDNWSGGKGVI